MKTDEDRATFLLFYNVGDERQARSFQSLRNVK
jgi:hypothetical protein